MLRNYFKLLGRPDSKTLERLTQEFPGQPDTGRIFAMTQARLHAGEEERFIASESRRPRWHYAATIAAALTFVIGSAAAGTFLLHPPAQPEQPALEAQAPAETTSASSETTSARAETTTAAGETTAEERTETTAAAAETAAEMTEGISTSVQEIVESSPETVTTAVKAAEPEVHTWLRQDQLAVVNETTAESEPVIRTTPPAETLLPEKTGDPILLHNGAFQLIPNSHNLPYPNNIEICAGYASSGTSTTRYAPTWLPDGFTAEFENMQETDELQNLVATNLCIYGSDTNVSPDTSSSRSTIWYAHFPVQEQATITGFDRITDYTYAETAVGSSPAVELYVTRNNPNNPFSHCLVWCDTDYAYMLTSCNVDLSLDTLIRMAESVSPIA